LIALVRQSLRFRELISTLLNRDLRARYRGSILGQAWMVLQPLAFLAVFYVVFESFLANRMPPELEARTGYFALAMFCGLIPWIGFGETITRAATCIGENGSLIKKFAFPSEIIPVTLVLSGIVQTLVGFSILTVAVFVLHGELPHHVWVLPIALALQVAFTLGLALLIAAACVFVRDIGSMMPMLMNFWFFMTPIFMFGRFEQSEITATVMRWNPMSYLIESYRAIFVYHPSDWQALLLTSTPEMRAKMPLVPADVSSPPLVWLGIFGLVALATLFLGYTVFMRNRMRFADEV
jgi:ABC-type polysaccharide/polyol phosphate export permease